jgi:exonuclease SbcD
MVTVLHFADLHIGVENHGRPDPATGLHSRLADFLRSFDELVEYALSNPVDLVLFAGDAYKNREPSPTHQREFARRLQRLSSAGIPVFLLTGNHDLPSTIGRADTLDIFATLEVPNVHVARLPGTYLIDTRSGPIQILAIPWVVRSHLLSREEFKNRSLSEIETLTLTKLESIVNKNIEQLDPTLPTILTAHGTVHGATYGSERSVMLGQEMILPTSLVNRDCFDYVALGHIHCHQVLHQTKPPVVYAGSLDRIDFGEEKEAKGFVIAHVERGKADFCFVPLTSTRPFVTIEVTANGTDPMAQIRQAIAAKDLEQAIVRLIIHTTMEKNHLLRDQEIHSLLSEAFKVATIVRDVQRTARLRLGGDRTVEEMTPLQLLERYLHLHHVSKERMARLLEYAQRVMGAEP